MRPSTRLAHYLPILEWGRGYRRADFGNDLIAAVIVTLMLIPQSLAYAMLAGLPPEVGIYASIVPIMLYAIFGSSRVLAVGPVAVVSLMTAAALGQVAEQGSIGYATAALTLAILSGAILIVMGVLRLGFLANFLSHPVISGFITASGLLIATSQLGAIMGVSVSGANMIALISGLWSELGRINPVSLSIGAAVVAFLLWLRRGFKPAMRRIGMRPRLADLLQKTGPVVAVILSTALVWVFDLQAHGVAIVGAVPQGLPPLTMPDFSASVVGALALPALLIAVIGFVESVSVAQNLAAKRRQRIMPDQELIGLGAANIGAAFTGGFPVTGGFARSVVNFDAGAATQAAGIMTAMGLCLAGLALTPLIYFLPKATLAATIIVAVLSLVDLGALRRIFTYSRFDFAAIVVTMGLTLAVGVEAGVSAGVAVSIILHLFKTARPHVAEVGLVPQTQHFRNINRHQVTTAPHLLTIRIDESLYFANARFLEDLVLDRVTREAAISDVVLMCSAVNEIDISALETLESLNQRLSDMGITLHLSEVKGPVTDRLARSSFLSHLTGQIYLSQYEAWQALSGGRAS